MSGRPVQVRAELLASEPVGAYRRLVLAAPAVGTAARPGQFVAVAVGDDPTAMLLRRAFSVHRAGPGGVELVGAAHGPGTRWLTERPRGAALDVVGPLGNPFPDPQPGRPVVLVGGGYGAAPLLWFGERLAAAGHRVHAVLGAAGTGRLFGVELAAPGIEVTVTTEDGSAGLTGRVTDALPALLAGTDAEIYACGPMGMLRAVAAVGAGHGVPVWCAVEEAMACGIGVCMTCVLPVRGADGTTRMVRSCTEGPTFAGTAVRWDAVGATATGTGCAVPADCLGAPAVPGTAPVVAAGGAR